MIIRMAQSDDEAPRSDVQIADLERRVLEQRRRVANEGAGFGAIEVLHLMEQTLASWRERKRA